MPSDCDSARWNMEHTDLLKELVAELEEHGCELFIERQNSFQVESASSGAVIGGEPDLIAVFPYGRTVVYDVKPVGNRRRTSFRCSSTCTCCPVRTWRAAGAGRSRRC